MRTYLRPLVLAALAVAVMASFSAHATICQYVDHAGNLHYTNKAPEADWRFIGCTVCKWDSLRGKEVCDIVPGAGRPFPLQARRYDHKPTSSSGTGFFVSDRGHVLTNHHVVAKCSSVFVTYSDKRLPAQVIASDPALDLAILKVAAKPHSYATFRAGVPIRIGEAVTTAGFPLKGLLASGPIVSTGIVNALGGIKNDPTKIQISAAIQPGNSGGPVVDANGSVIGVVEAKLDALKLAAITGDIAQNINFAVKANVARSFLEANQVRPRIGEATHLTDSVTVSAVAISMTVPVECP